jgi:phosphate transport system protein
MHVHLQNELEQLKRKLLHLATMAEQSVQKAVRGLIELDETLAKDVLVMDHQVDLKEVEIEEDCLKVLALHNPVANDLRLVIASLKINNDLERIGDLGVNIAERTLFLSKQPRIKPPIDFAVMSKSTLVLLKMALDALVQKDSEKANEVLRLDDDVDAMNRLCYKNVYERLKTEPENVESLIHYLSVSRHLERVADYATNISEDVIYMIEGRIIRHSPENYFEGNSPKMPLDN